MFKFPAANQAHDHKAGQRDGFEKSSVGRLNGLKHSQRPPRRHGAQGAHEWVGRRRMEMSRVANRDKCRQRVTDHRQPERGKPCRGKNGQFERQWNHLPPGLRSQTQPSRQRAVSENRNRERTVCFVTLQDFRGQITGVKFADALSQPLLAGGNGRLVCSRRVWPNPKGRPNQRGRAKIAAAANGVTPATIRVRMGREPGHALFDQPV